MSRRALTIAGAAFVVIGILALALSSNPESSINLGLLLVGGSALTVGTVGLARSIWTP